MPIKIRHINILLFSILLVALLSLYRVNQSAKNVENQVKEVSLAIAKERQKIDLLEKEWNYLTVPNRILDKSKIVLPHLQTPTPSQIVVAENLAERLDIEGSNPSLPNLVRGQNFDGNPIQVQGNPIKINSKQTVLPQHLTVKNPQ